MMSYNYGLSFSDLQHQRKRLKKQEDYLENNFFTTSTGQHKSLLDVSYSANLSKRYYPRILNKVNTFVSYCLSRDLTPVFLTVTLDGFFRDLLKGDFTRYDMIKDQYIKHIPNNDRNGHYQEFLEKREALTPKDLYKILSHQLHNFMRSHAVQQIRKQGGEYAMIRVTEPHKDGTPHFHILMYLPDKDIPAVFKAFKKAFPAPQNHKKLTYKNTKGKNRRDGIEIYPGSGLFETHGFQVDLRSPASYILKYILKSFRNLIEGNELDYLQAWYMQHRIPRIITTHTLIAQDIYQAVAPLDDDWFYLTHIKKEAYFAVDRDSGYFKFDDGNGRQIIGERGLVQIFNQGKLVKSYGEKKDVTFAPTKKRKYEYKYFISRDYDDGSFLAFFDSALFAVYAGVDFVSDYDPRLFADWNSLPPGCDLVYESVPKTKSIASMTDFELYDHYINFDFDKYNPARYAIAHNELVDRGLINAQKVNPNDYNTDFDF